jgi:hypothetical protein
MPNYQSCKKCRFYFETGSKCRRFPPTIQSSLACVPNHPEVSADGWCGEYKPIPSKDKAPKVDPKDSAGMNAVVGAYIGKFKEVYGTEPALSSADRAAAKSLLKTFGKDPAIKIVEKFVENPPAWNKEHKTIDLRFIPANANKIIAASKPSEGREIWDFLTGQARLYKEKPEWRDYVDAVRKSGEKIEWQEFVGS